jgi:hypothetical protein
MKLLHNSVLLIFTVALLTCCNSKKPVNNEPVAAVDTVSVPDTGFTGIKQYMSGKYRVKEVTFKNGVRQGLMKAFYVTGEVRQTFWYENGLREDSSIWFYTEGQKFRSTPYKNDTVDGIQRQYYRTGGLKAKIGYSKGFRTTFFEEYNKNGKVVHDYPSVVVKTIDEYKTRSKYTISLELSDKAYGVKFYKGDLINGLFDTAHLATIKLVKGTTGIVELKKSTGSRPAYVGVIADILTNFGNHYLVYKKIDLPYSDLK